MNEPTRSAKLLTDGLRALEYGDREAAGRYLEALFREGESLEYRDLACALQEAQAA